MEIILFGTLFGQIVKCPILLRVLEHLMSMSTFIWVTRCPSCSSQLVSARDERQLPDSEKGVGLKKNAEDEAQANVEINKEECGKKNLITR